MPGPRALRILHVDDDAVNRLVLDQMLLAFGHETAPLASAHEALQALDAGGFDLVMTDLHMPEMTGEQLLATIREREGSVLPVIAVSADVTTRPAEAYADLGFAGFLAKPLTFARLESMLDHVRFGPEGVMLAQAQARMTAYLKVARAR